MQHESRCGPFYPSDLGYLFSTMATDIVTLSRRVNAQDTSAEPTPDLQLEIAHLLLIDVVGYSRLLVNEQIELLQELNQIVRNTECFRTAETSGKLIRMPTGDGMALLFFHSPEEPVRCALEVSRALQKHPTIQVRMGIHSGPVNRVTDVNDKTNIAGSGINVAQRVLDCGDAGHILLSAHIAEDLAQYRPWQPYLHDLGECEVKHGLRTAFTAARAEQEAVVRAHSDGSPLSGLGLIDAGLGRKEEALREGRRAVELTPVAKSSLEGSEIVANLALIYAWTGERDLAIEQLEVAAKLANGPHYGDLRLNPMWDPLRGDPRFEKIVASLAPKDLSKTKASNTR